MNVVPMSRFRRGRQRTFVVFTDLQVEYITSDRAFAIRGVGPCLKNCRMLLESVRDLGLPICHFRQIGSGNHFNSASRFSRWIDDLRPRSSEMVFERSLPSCYSNDAFKNLLSRADKPTVILAGLAGEEAVLSTSIDALHRGHKLIFVQDASASHAIGNLGEDEAHAFLTSLISIYSDVTTTEELTAQFRQSPVRSLYQ